MKASHLLLIGFLAASSAFALQPVDPKLTARAEVLFFEPLKFTDVRDRAMGDSSNTTYLEQIRDHLLEQAKYYVPAGHKLTVTITDIDMAGEFEPWHGPRWDDVRIVKDIYPPRITLNFRLTDADGKVVKEGKRDLRDLAFMMKITMSFRDDTVRHEKALLDDWLRSDFPRVRKG